LTISDILVCILATAFDEILPWVESSLRTSHSDVGGKSVQDLDPGFLNPASRSYIYIAAVFSPWCSPGGSTILGWGLCYPSTDLLVIVVFVALNIIALVFLF